MAISVLNNIASLQAQNELGATNTNLQRTLFRLSTGLRITTGADDAAGLSIADGLRAQTRALNQATSNANDGISFLQVADGALSEVSNLLTRAITLAEQSANGTLTDTQRDSVELEFQQIYAEINRIGTNTTFNGTSVFTGSSTSIFVGDTSNTSTIAFTARALAASAIVNGSGANSQSVSTQVLSTSSGASAALTVLNSAVANVASQRAVLGATSNRLSSTIAVISAQSQNLTAAESQIRDANVATEVANLTKFQILTQTGIAALTQANQSSQALLALVR